MPHRSANAALDNVVHAVVSLLNHVVRSDLPDREGQHCSVLPRSICGGEQVVLERPVESHRAGGSTDSNGVVGFDVDFRPAHLIITDGCREIPDTDDVAFGIPIILTAGRGGEHCGCHKEQHCDFLMFWYITLTF